jgi:GxxExxY protein
MPIHCDLSIKPTSQAEFGDLDYSVMRHVFETQNDIGRLAQEHIYQNDLRLRVRSAGISCDCEVGVRLTHKDFTKLLFIDLVACHSGVYELKAVTSLTKEHEAQLMTYLYLLGLQHGKLVNFRTPKVESRFVNATIPLHERVGFTVCTEEYCGPAYLSDFIVALLRDWGTCLTLSLYLDAIVHFLGGIEKVERLLPLSRSGIELGNQRFHVISPDQAIHLTAFADVNEAYDIQVNRLLSLSPLRAIHRINIAAHQVNFRTVTV